MCNVNRLSDSDPPSDSHSSRRFDKGERGTPAVLVELGQIIRVRSRQYLVEDVILPDSPIGDTRVRLACLEDDAQGDSLEVFWEREIDAQLLEATSWESVKSRGFDNPHYFSAYLHALRWNCVTSTDPKLFQAPYRAGIEVNA